MGPSVPFVGGAAAALAVGFAAKLLTGPRRSSSSGKPKVYYYPARGKANFIRLIFAEADVEFDDEVFDMTNEADKAAFLAKVKVMGGHTTTNIPLVYIDGKYLTQTMAITMYLARKYGLYPKDIAGAYRADMLMAAAEDFRTENYKPMPLMGGGAEQKKKYEEEVVPKHLANFARLLGASDYFVGSKLTCADLCVWETLSTANCLVPGVLDKHPTLKAFHDRVLERPRIAKYVASEQFTKLWAFPAL